MKTDETVAKTALTAAYDTLKGLDIWTNDNLFEALKALAEKLALKNGQIMYPVRIALSGKQTTPGGATELAVVLGKDETLKRIEYALTLL